MNLGSVRMKLIFKAREGMMQGPQISLLEARLAGTRSIDGSGMTSDSSHRGSIFTHLESLWQKRQRPATASGRDSDSPRSASRPTSRRAEATRTAPSSSTSGTSHSRRCSCATSRTARSPCVTPTCLCQRLTEQVFGFTLPLTDLVAAPHGPGTARAPSRERMRAAGCLPPGVTTTEVCGRAGGGSVVAAGAEGARRQGAWHDRPGAAPGADGPDGRARGSGCPAGR